MNQNQIILPTVDDIATFPLFQNLSHENIFIINTLEQCQTIAETLYQAPLLGFDTESKPTFLKGEVSTGPHLIQLATFNNAYLFQVTPEILDFLKPIFNNPLQIKVGFGLKNDAHLFRKKHIELNSILDLAKAFTPFGIKQQIGVRNAIALLFQLNFPKSKKISTSNWSKKKLSPEQIVYAAADAYAPVLIFQELLKLDLLPHHITKLAIELGITANPQKSST